MKKGDIKYSGNKKVMVVEPSGDGTGAIVQEIHVEGEEEFPAGATFFARKLEDEHPKAITWEGKQIAAEHECYAASKERLEKLRRDIDIQIEANKEHLRDLIAVGNVTDASALNRVIDFLAGDLRYVAIMEGYSGYQVLPFVEAITRTDNWHFKRYDGLKLMTLTGGRNDRKKCLNWNLNEYHDGSGCNTTVVPCKTKKEAIATVQAYIEKRVEGGNSVHIESAEALGCKIPTEYLEARLASAKKSLADYRKKKEDDKAKQIREYEARIKKLESLIA
jgi:hypothetical protein